MLVLEIIGLSVLHRISIGRAIAAVLIPLVLCCGCLIVAIVMFGTALMAALGGFKP